MSTARPTTYESVRKSLLLFYAEASKGVIVNGADDAQGRHVRAAAFRDGAKATALFFRSERTHRDDKFVRRKGIRHGGTHGGVRMPERRRQSGGVVPPLLMPTKGNMPPGFRYYTVRAGEQLHRYTEIALQLVGLFRARPECPGH
jgi:hypothetical protein